MLEYQSENSLIQEHLCIDLYTNFSFGAHLHQDWEFVLVLSGDIILSTREEETHLYPGEMALIFANQVHAYRTLQESKTMIGTFSGNYVSTFIKKVKGMKAQKLAFVCGEELKNYILIQLLPEYQAGEINFPAPNQRKTLPNPSLITAKAILYAICANYLEKQQMVPAVEQNNDLLDQLLAYVDKNYREDITLESAARAIGYDKSYLSRFFSKTVGMNFRHFINQCRVNYACDLIRHTDMLMTDISLDAGFQNNRSFNRAFKEITGKTPTDFKG